MRGANITEPLEANQGNLGGGDTRFAAPALSDGEGVDLTGLVAALTHAKAVFQLRAISAVLGLPTNPVNDTCREYPKGLGPARSVEVPTLHSQADSAEAQR